VPNLPGQLSGAVQLMQLAQLLELAGPMSQPSPPSPSEGKDVALEEAIDVIVLEEVGGSLVDGKLVSLVADVGDVEVAVDGAVVALVEAGALVSVVEDAGEVDVSGALVDVSFDSRDEADVVAGEELDDPEPLASALAPPSGELLLEGSDDV
jgi:hypothetical protein